MNIHLKPLHLSVSQKSVAMDQVLVSQYVSGTVDTIAGKSANSVFFDQIQHFQHRVTELYPYLENTSSVSPESCKLARCPAYVEYL